MWRRFTEGSIRRQIVTLAVLPIFLVGVLGVMTEPNRVEETELTQAEVVAARIALVAAQVESAQSPDMSEAVLAATRASGLEVQRTGPFAEQSTASSSFQERLVSALSGLHNRNVWAVVGKGAEPEIIVEINSGLLAFSPKATPVPGLNDNVVNIFLSVVIIFLPVAFLSIYSARLVTKPLTRIAAAAQSQRSADPAARIFAETGPLEIRQLARRLNNMNAEIQDMLKQRTAMLRAVSHDLRTPLTRLKLRIERSVPPDTASVLMRDLTALNQMIDETLTYLRNESETEAPRRTDLPSLLRTISTDFADMGFSVSYSGPNRLPFVCRARAITRAVTNLVDNGTKHGDRVEITLASLADGAVRIDVSDDGPGIPENLRAKVLEPFAKGDPSRSPGSRSGFGLGLSIVNDVVRRHEGALQLNPLEPHGLVAAIVLPAIPPSQEP